MKKFRRLIIGYIATTLAFLGLVVGAYAQESAIEHQAPDQMKGPVMERDLDKAAHHTENGFQNNPYVETAAPKGFLFYTRRFWHSVFRSDVPDDHFLSEENALRHKKLLSGDSITWIGHATFLITISGTTILTDPFFSEFASPLSWAGPRRMLPPGISLENLPPIDMIIISHNHYDHLDSKTIRKLPNKARIHVIVPLGLKSFFEDRGYPNVTELDWNEEVVIGNFILTSLPAVHDSARSLSDHNKTLWASWAISSPQKNFLFIGDSGYSDSIFKKIGEQFGGFDYAFIPISAYEPRELMWMSHVTPEEAVTIGQDVHATTLIASHWGTINLSDEPPWEPSTRFMKAGKESGIAEKNIWIMKVGETRSLSQ